MKRLITSTIALGAATALGIAALPAGFPLAPAPAEAREGATALIEAFYGAIQSTMQRGGSASARYSVLLPAIQRTFDVPAMTRIAVGPRWSSIPGNRQAALQRAFASFLAATYANRLDTYSGEKFEVSPSAEPVAGGRLVRSRVREESGRTTAIDYVVGSSGRAVDVRLNGSISEMAARRAEFESILASNGPEALEASLRDRTSRLLGS
ncbi:MAG: ABC transporter substrate-binding protein [Methylobacteriaceae bacterium]|nr:ABC transporter substrate-binding protein [Methylobacteriaceae bacterium]